MSEPTCKAHANHCSRLDQYKDPRLRVGDGLLESDEN